MTKKKILDACCGSKMFYDLIAGSVDSEEEADRICEEYEPYWTKCILVTGYN